MCEIIKLYFYLKKIYSKYYTNDVINEYSCMETAIILPKILRSSEPLCTCHSLGLHEAWTFDRHANAICLFLSYFSRVVKLECPPMSNMFLFDPYKIYSAYNDRLFLCLYNRLGLFQLL